MSIEELFKIGQSFFLNNKYDKAKVIALELIQDHPEFQNAYQLMALISYQMGNYEEARNWFYTFENKSGNDYVYLGNISYELKDYEQSRENYEKALQLIPDNGRIFYNIALTYYEQAHYEQAIAHLKHTVKVLPDYEVAYIYLADSYFQLALLYQSKLEYYTAEYYFKESLAIKEDIGIIIHFLANQYLQGHLKEVIESCLYYLQAPFKHGSVQFQQQLQQEQSTLMSLLILCEYSAYGVSNQQLYRRVLEWGRRFSEHLKPGIVQKRGTSQRLRIAYISQEFSFNSSSMMIRSILKNHNRATFEIFAYSDTPKQDTMTQKIKSLVEHWKDVKSLNDWQLYQLMKKDKVDIIVDLGGHTHSRRLLFYALKPAPIQLTGIGFGLPTGLNAVDYFVSDEVFIPPELSRLCREKVFYLPDCLLHWEPPNYRFNPSKKLGKTVFGCGNAIYKLNQSVFEVWAKILLLSPDSCLHLKSTEFSETHQCQKVYEQFEALGIEPERIILQGKTSHREHLLFYQQLDLVLDPFPYGGGISTCEALWMGIPVVTLSTGRRVGVSILSHLGLDPWIASSQEEYIELAVEIASHSEKHANLTSDLRERLINSSICNGQLYVKMLENMYHAIWHSKLA